DGVEGGEAVVQRDDDVHGGSGSSSGGGLEAFAVLGGAGVQATAEAAAHGLHRAEAAAPGHDLDRVVAGLELLARALDAQRGHVGGGGDADLAAEGAGEVARAHEG